KVIKHAAVFHVSPLRSFSSSGYPLWLILLCMLLMSASPLSLSMHDFSHGTAVFVIRTPHAVVVAADSRSVSGNDIPHPEPVCKIRRFGNAYIVVHGMTQDLPTGYDVFSTLQAVGEQTELLADQIATFERLVTPPLEKTLQ